MKKLLFIPLLFVAFLCSAQYGNFKQVRLTSNTDSTLISGVGQIRFDPITSKFRFGNGSSWFTPGGGGNISGTLSANRIPYATGSSSLGIDTLVWDSSNQRLGIGLFTPLYKVHIYDTIREPGLTLDGGSSVIRFLDRNSVQGGSIGITGIDVTGARGLFFRAPDVSLLSDNWFTARFGGSANKVYLGDTGSRSMIQSGHSLDIRPGVSGTPSTAYSTGLFIEDIGSGSIRMGLMTNSPTARFHLPAGTTAIAPLNIPSGTNLTTPVDGAMEYNGSHLYFTIGSTRHQIDQGGVDQASSTSTASGTITLDMSGKAQRAFYGSASFSTAKAVDFSNAGNAVAFSFSFEVTNVAAVMTWPTSVLMADVNWDGDDWTPPSTGKFKAAGTLHNGEWFVSISGAFQ